MLRPLKNPCEIAVIGGGMAGLCAAGHAARLGRSVTLFEGSGVWGGQIATVGHVDGLPVAGLHSGQDVAIGLLEAMRGPLLRIVERGVARVEAAADLTLTDDAGEIHHPGAVIVASGASLRRLGVPGERELAGRGVSHCATCDGGFFRGEDVAVVGGGDSALQEALTLTDLCRHVHIVCRSATRAKRSYVDRLAAKRNASFVWGAAVTAVLGDKGVSGLALRDGADGRAFELACTGVFPFIGVAPNGGSLPASLLDQSGHLRAGPDLLTADPRIFAAGAIRAGFGGQIAQAAAEGIGAAEAAAAMLGARNFGRPAAPPPARPALQSVHQEP